MKTLAKKDANHDEIVSGLRQIGCTVQTLHQIGNGCPDILVGACGTNFVIEIKDGDKPPSRRKLTVDEKKWHEEWVGRVYVVNSLDEAIKLVRACVC